MTIFHCKGRDITKLATFIFVGLSLSACGQPEVEACERYIEKGLKSPSSYSRTELKVFDEALTAEKLLEDHPEPKKNEIAQAESGRLTRRLVFIEYDADNSYGTPIRDTMACDFHLIDGKTPSKISLQSRVSISDLNRSMRSLAEQGQIASSDQFKGSSYECCEN